MAINAVSAAADQSQVSQSEFLKLLLAQLKYQDPTKPVDNKDFIVQMAQFSSLAQTQEINQSVASLLNFSMSQQSIGLLGKEVTFEDANGFVQTGDVSAIDFSQAEPSISVASGGITLTTVMGKIKQVKP